MTFQSEWGGNMEKVGDPLTQLEQNMVLLSVMFTLIIVTNYNKIGWVDFSCKFLTFSDILTTADKCLVKSITIRYGELFLVLPHLAQSLSLLVKAPIDPNRSSHSEWGVHQISWSTDSIKQNMAL